MIKSFRNKNTEKVFLRQIPKGFPSNLARRAFRKLRMLDQAKNIDDLRVLPGNSLEQLKGQRQGQYSIRINEQWRICFEWRLDGVYSVEIVDYH